MKKPETHYQHPDSHVSNQNPLRQTEPRRCIFQNGYHDYQDKTQNAGNHGVFEYTIPILVMFQGGGYKEGCNRKKPEYSRGGNIVDNPLGCIRSTNRVGAENVLRTLLPFYRLLEPISRMLGTPVVLAARLVFRAKPKPTQSTI